MLDRRQVLKTGAAAAALGAAAGPGIAFADAAGDRLDKVFDTFMSQTLDRSPETATGLGLDLGARAWEKSKLDDRSLAALAGDKTRNTQQLATLKAFDRASLSGMDRVSYDVVMFGLQSTEDADKRYDYGPGGAGAPYIISQLTGAYSGVPDFLDSQHQIAVKADADAYLARLAAFGTAMDQEADVVRHDVKLGCIPPDFALAKTLDQMTKLRAQKPSETVLVTSVERRAKEKNIPGDYAGQAEKIVTDKVYPALDRQIALVKDMQAHATHDAGVWKLKDGAQYYVDFDPQLDDLDREPCRDSPDGSRCGEDIFGADRRHHEKPRHDRRHGRLSACARCMPIRNSAIRIRMRARRSCSPISM